MNRFLLVLFPLSLWSVASNAQVSMCNQVIGTTGFSAIEQNKYWAYTVGEVAIFTLSNTQDVSVLTQGFHQPDLCLPVSANSPEWTEWDLEVYPNPITDFVTIHFSPDKKLSLSADVYDVLGNLITQNIGLEHPDGSRIDCRNWQSGLYFLVIRIPESEASATIRLVRL